MKNERSSIIFCALVFLFLTLSGTASAGAVITLSPNSDGVYTLQGTGMDGTAAMDITIVYDPTGLANPRVANGPLITGALSAVNANTSGMVRMVIITTKAFSGSGTIATLTFDRIGDTAGAMLGLKALCTTIEGKPLPVLAQVTKPSEVTADNKTTDAGTQGGPGVSTSSQAQTAVSTGSSQATEAIVRAPLLGPAGGIVVEPKMNDGAVTAGTPTVNEPAVEPITAKASAEARGVTVSQDASGKKTFFYKSVLDRFKEYKGKRTVAAYTALFQQGTTTWVRQVPNVQLADGAATVKVYITTAGGGGVAPEYALMNARLVSIKRDNDAADTWVLEACPETGVLEARLIISRGNEMIVFPLVIAPRLDLQKKGQARVSEKDLERYLNGQRLDVNKDDRSDYLDDYIYTANVLAQMKTASSVNKSK